MQYSLIVSSFKVKTIRFRFYTISTLHIPLQSEASDKVDQEFYILGGILKRSQKKKKKKKKKKKESIF